MKPSPLNLKLLGLQERGLAAADAAAEQAKGALYARGDLEQLAKLTTVVEKPGVKARGSKPIGDAPVCLEHLCALIDAGGGMLVSAGCACVFEALPSGARVVISRSET